MNKYLKICVVFLILAIALAGCKKETEMPQGLPVINRVAQPLDLSADLREGDLNDWLIIYGQNLSKAQKVTFNNEPVERKDFYAVDTMISIKIPRKIPSVITNKIEVTTLTGVAVYDFDIKIPALVLEGMYNEYTLEGETLSLIGKNFDLYDINENGAEVTFPGGFTVPVIEASANTLKVVVPVGAQSGKLSIYAPSLSVPLVTDGFYKDNRNLFFPLTPYPADEIYGVGMVSAGPIPASITGNYYHVKQNWDANFQWLTLFSVPRKLGVVGSTANYVLKFEVSVQKPIKNMQATFYLDYAPVYSWKPFEQTGSFTTNGQWKTITIPMSQIQSNLLDKEYVWQITFDGHGPDDYDVAFCNFRIVPAK
ncbi:glycan-binding surface protein [Pseudopedobacter beijingensis]|uniref:Glycan-binding surface protein n=1 Tax=Pseudopedobacter beijingensis TaxID=1207056 RepID=A0ABW4I9L4_9SPHI